MQLHIPYHIGTVHGEPGFVHLDIHTNTMGHSLITGTLGVAELQRRLVNVLGEISRDIEVAVTNGAVIE